LADGKQRVLTEIAGRPKRNIFFWKRIPIVHQNHILKEVL